MFRIIALATLLSTEVAYAGTGIKDAPSTPIIVFSMVLIVGAIGGFLFAARRKWM